MHCPKCGSESQVIESRQHSKRIKQNYAVGLDEHMWSIMKHIGYQGIRRRRECYSCQWRFTTYEFTTDHLAGLDLRKEPLSNRAIIQAYSQAIETLETAMQEATSTNSQSNVIISH